MSWSTGANFLSFKYSSFLFISYFIMFYVYMFVYAFLPLVVCICMHIFFFFCPCSCSTLKALKTKGLLIKMLLFSKPTIQSLYITANFKMRSIALSKSRSHSVFSNRFITLSNTGVLSPLRPPLSPRTAPP